MKKITLLFFVLSSFLWQINAQVTIGSGTLQSENAPFEPFFGYSYTQTVYLASEINASGAITDLQWYYSGTSALPNSQDLTIYIGESSRTVFASTTDWEPIGSLTQVYAGGITVTAGTPGWVSITLDTPFAYSGTGNLIIAVKEGLADYDDSGDDFFNSQVTTNRSISYFSDTINPSPATPPTASNIDDTIANVILGGITQACPNPSDLTVSNISSNSADLTWTQTGTAATWNIEIVPSGTTPTGTPTYSGVTSPYSLTNLSPITSYDLYVQADCGGETSAWSGPSTFATLCDVFVPDYLATFDTFLQDCWEEADNGTPATGPTGLGVGSWGADGFANVGTTGANNINLFASSKQDWLISPLFDLTGGPFQVELDLAIMQWLSSANAGVLGSDDLVQLLITTDAGATWTALITWDNTSILPVGGEHYVYNLSAYSGQTVQFAMWASEGTVDDSADNDISFDNFEVRNVPTCPEPTGITVAGVTSTTANISWTPGDSETAWEVAIQPVGTGTPAGTGDPTSDNLTYMATGLNPATNYEVYVRASCGAEYGSWVGPVNFSTECVTFVAPYTEGFENGGTIPLCWAMSGGEDWEFSDTTGVDHIGNDGVITGSTATNGYFAWVDSSGSDAPAVLLSPFVDVSGLTTPALSFYEISNNEGNANSTLTVEVWDGAAWNTMGTYNTNTAGWELKVINLSSLTITGDVQARFTFSETVPSDFYDDIAIDDVTFDELPACPAPSTLTSTNISLTSTEVSWTEVGGATIWNIEYGPTGFVQGTGTVETDVTNPYLIENLTPDTEYQFYVQSNCGASDGLSSWTGPFGFYTGYCESVPSSNDGQGVSNVTIGVTDFPSLGDVTYENQTTPVVNAFQGIETTVAITFATGFTYGTNIWIDFNDNLVFEASELVYQGVSTNANPTTLDATFTMPADAPLGQHRMRIGTADSGQATPNPCYDGSFGVTLDFTINILVLDCVLPAADYTAVADCDLNQFFIDVNVTDLGDATSLEISNSFNGDMTQATGVDTYQIGPFDFGSVVKVFVTNEQNGNCVISSSNITLLGCPPANDECVNATVAVVNQGASCDLTTSGTILAASPSNVPASSCGGNANDDVWFQFTALHEVELISLINVTGGTPNLDHAVYSGSCGALTEIYCTTATASISEQLTVGNTYYVRVFSFGGVEETSTFDLCIQKAPDNTICEQSANFCSAGGSSVGQNIIGFPNSSSVACLGSIPNPSWNIIQIGDPGLIEIEIVQTSSVTGNGIDVDFVLWGPFDSDTDFCNLGLEVDCPSCPFSNNPDNGFYPFGNIVDCSYSGSSIENLTIDNAQTGELYVLLVTNFSNQPGSVSITQTNSGTDAGTTVAEIQVDLGGNQDLCGIESVVLTADSPFADAYEWYADGFQIEGETGPTLTVTESNTYTVIVYDSQCDVTAQETVSITLGLEATATPVDDIVTCDDISGDGFEDFDLESQTAAILGTQDPTLFDVTYHLSQGDALSNTGALTSPYTNVSTPQQIWVRVQDANAPSCIATTTFNLVISGATPTATSANIEVCDDVSGDGFEVFDLTENDVNILNGQNPADFTVVYYASEADANAGTSPLVSPYTNISNPQTIWARVDNNAAVDCFAVASFDLMVSDLPITSFLTDFDYEVCPDATEPIFITANAQNYAMTDVSIVWYKDDVVIEGETGLTLPVLTEGFYEIQVTFNESGCTTTVGQDVIELDNCIIPEGISPGVSPGFNDTFDLSNFNVTRIEIFNRLGTLVYSKDNYTNEWYGQSNNGDELPVGTYFYTMIYEGGAKQRSAWVYINK